MWAWHCTLASAICFRVESQVQYLRIGGNGTQVVLFGLVLPKGKLRRAMISKQPGNIQC